MIFAYVFNAIPRMGYNMFRVWGVRSATEDRVASAAVQANIVGLGVEEGTANASHRARQN